MDQCSQMSRKKNNNDIGIGSNLDPAASRGISSTADWGAAVKWRHISSLLNNGRIIYILGWRIYV